MALITKGHNVADKVNGWDMLSMWAGMLPGVATFGQDVARGTVQRLLGFWLLYHLYGGIHQGIAHGVFSSSSAYRQLAEFETVFGVSVEDFNAPLAEVIAQAPKKGL